MDEIKEGDVVALKSGSPKMCVGSIRTSADGIKVADCYWSNYDTRMPVEFTYPVVCLKKLA